MDKEVRDDDTTAVSSAEQAILNLLDQDIVAHPEQVRPIVADLARRLQSLVSGASVEMEIPLPPDDVRGE